MASLDVFTRDYTEILAQVNAKIANDGLFRDITDASTISSIAELIAFTIDHTEYNLQVQNQEQYIDSAMTRKALWSLANMGVAPFRKRSATLTVSATNNRPETTSLTPFQTLTARGTTWCLLIDRVGFQSGATKDIEVMQGIPRTITQTGGGQENQYFEIGNDFNVEHNSVVVEVNGEAWNKQGRALFNAPFNSFSESTTNIGRTLIRFGNADTGIPGIGSTVQISWLESNGALGNSTIVGDEFILNAPGFSIVSKTETSGGADEDSIEDIRLTVPRRFAANGRAVSKLDYISKLREFRGIVIADADSEGDLEQRTNKRDVTMMNRLRVGALHRLQVIEQVFPISSTNQSFALSLVPVKGSVAIDAQSGRTFYDSYGSGVLAHTQVTGAANNVALFTSNTNTIVTNDAQMAIKAGRGISYSRKPTKSNPLTYIGPRPTGTGGNIDAVSITTNSSNASVDRGAPARVLFQASTLANPPLGSDDGWDTFSELIPLPDLPNVSTVFGVTIPDNDVAPRYQQWRIRIDESHGTGNLRIQNVQTFRKGAVRRGRIDYDNKQIQLTGTQDYGNSMTVRYVSGEPSVSERQEILDFLEPVKGYTTQVDYDSIKLQRFNVGGEIIVRNGFDLSTVLDAVRVALYAEFRGTGGVLRESISRSDIGKVVGAVAGVDSYFISAPTNDLARGTKFFYFINDVADGDFTIRYGS